MIKRTRSKMQVPYFQAPNNVFELDLSAKEKLVLIYLVRCANQGSEAFPSYSTIARNCTISRSSALRAIRKLEAAGLVTVERRPKGNKDNYSNIYHIPSSTMTPGSSTMTPGGGSTMTPYKELVQEKELPILGSSIVNKWNTKTQDPKGTFKGNGSTIDKLISGHDPDRISQAIDNYYELLDDQWYFFSWQYSLPHFLGKHKEGGRTWERFLPGGEAYEQRREFIANRDQPAAPYHYKKERCPECGYLNIPGKECRGCLDQAMMSRGLSEHRQKGGDHG